MSHGCAFLGVGALGGLGWRGGMAKKPDLDEPTLRIMERMVNMPPKPHDEMKIGKPKAKRVESPGQRGRKSQRKKSG